MVLPRLATRAAALAVEAVVGRSALVQSVVTAGTRSQTELAVRARMVLMRNRIVQREVEVEVEGVEERFQATLEAVGRGVQEDWSC